MKLLLLLKYCYNNNSKGERFNTDVRQPYRCRLATPYNIVRNILLILSLTFFLFLFYFLSLSSSIESTPTHARTHTEANQYSHTFTRIRCCLFVVSARRHKHESYLRIHTHSHTHEYLLPTNRVICTFPVGLAELSTHVRLWHWHSRYSG